MLKAGQLVLAALIIAMFIVGCSGTSLNPLTPGDNPDPVREPGSERVLWGLWNITLDPATMDIGIAPIREAQAHFDITNMIIPPACDDCFAIAVNSFDPVTRILDADVTLRNPTPIGGKDVRGILHTNDYGHLITNPDNWTDLWDMPGGDTINPFIAFAKTEPNRIFAGSAEHTENYLVYIPIPPAYFAITFAVDASWPGNCKEPYMIGTPSLDSELYQYTNATTDLYVDVYDWQDDVEGVQISAPAITGEEFTDCTLLSGTTWTCAISNTLAAPSGDYEILIKATSFSTSLYHFAGISIDETDGPVITDIDPTSSEQGALIDNLKITGSGFLFGFDVELRMDLEPPIIGENEWIFTTTTCYVDFNIPPSAEPGLYDVAFTNGDSKQFIALELFEVLCPIPTVTGIDPATAELGETITDVEITGTKFTGTTADVLLKKTGEPDIAATNISVDTETTIFCDIEIPWVNSGGSYDVEVTNSFGGKGTGVGLFEVTEPPQTGWAVTFGDAEYDYGQALAIDDSDNSYMGGSFGGTVDFNPDPIEEWNLTSHPIENDAFLAKYNSFGALEWAINWGGTEYNNVNAVALDDMNNIFVTGSFRETTDFDPGPGEVNHTSNNDSGDFYVSKFDNNGNFQWVLTWGGAGLDHVAGIGFDSLSNIYLTGFFDGSIDFDPDPVDEEILTSNGNSDMYLLKLDPTGDFIWARTWGGTGYDSSNGISVDTDGNAYVVGTFWDSVDFDPDPVGEDIHWGAITGNSYISKFDTDGNYLWGHDWGDLTDNDNANAVILDGTGDNVFVGGAFRGTVDFDPDPIDEVIHSSTNIMRDACLIKYDSSGDFQWCRVWGGTGRDYANSIATNPTGDLFITGTFEQTTDLDPDPVDTDEHISAGDKDWYLTKLDSTGDFIWGRAWGSSSFSGESSLAVAANPDGASWITGQFLDSVDFDPDPVLEDTHTSAGYDDGFLIKLLPNGLWSE